MRKAGIYARRSPRPTESETIGRQMADARGLAADLGWEIVEEYVDKDISAYSEKRRRPAYRQMLKDLQAGRIDAIVVAHVTRLYRHPVDLVEFIDTVRKAKAEVRTVTSGYFDLATAAGRKHAYQAGLDAMAESDLLGERVARERRARAAAGIPTPGGLRPFGFEADKTTLNEHEAAAIREVAEMVAAGVMSMWQVAQDWNARGITTTAGNPWEVTAVRRVLISPRTAGLRVHRGVVVGPARWPAIIDETTHARIRAMSTARRRGAPRPSSWLLSGLIRCPNCHRTLVGSKQGDRRKYVCAPSPGSGRGCGQASVLAGPIEAKVDAAVHGWLANPPKAMRRWLAPADGPDPQAEIRAIHAQRSAVTQQFAKGNMAQIDFDQALDSFATRLAELEDGDGPRSTIDPARAAVAYQRGEIAERRATIIDLVDCPMTLAPGRAAEPADRLAFRPKWAR